MRGTLAPKQDKGLEAFNRVDQQIVASVNAIESESIILAKALREMAVEQKDGSLYGVLAAFRRSSITAKIAQSAGRNSITCSEQEK